MENNRKLVEIDEQNLNFRVAREAFVSDPILAEEYEKIFDTCWLYVGHVSEFKKAGDFVTRTIARRNLLVTMGTDGKINAFFNTCPHRGATVCRERSGNSKNFQCFYHGWVFGCDGNLKSQPGKERYCADFAATGAGNLVPVPRFDIYAGFCFVSFNPEVEPLPDYLAGAKEYLDLISKYSESGMGISQGTQEYAIRANWKLLVENSVDGYHAVSTHATYLDYLKNTNGGLSSTKLEGTSRDLGNGHAVLEYAAPWGRPIASWVPLWGDEGKQEIDQIYARLVELHGESMADRMAHKNRNLLIFPNLVINDIMAITVRTFYPQAPNYMLVNGWSLAPNEESAWARKFRLSNFLEFLGPGGFATPDDVEALESCQNGFNNYRLVPWSDISKGMGKETPNYDDELQMRAFWTRWNQCISSASEKRPTNSPFAGLPKFKEPQVSTVAIEKEPVVVPSSSDFAAFVTRTEVEDLLYHEAELLDTWRLRDWLELFTDDGEYYVPSTDLPRDASADDSLFYIADNHVRLQERVIRLMKKTAHSEYPRSRTRHLVSNVRILGASEDEIRVAAAFVTYRMKFGNSDAYIGSTHYRLRRVEGTLRIIEKRCFLDLEALRPHGRVSIIL